MKRRIVALAMMLTICCSATTVMAAETDHSNAESINAYHVEDNEQIEGVDNDGMARSAKAVAVCADGVDIEKNFWQKNGEVQVKQQLVEELPGISILILTFTRMGAIILATTL